MSASRSGRRCRKQSGPRTRCTRFLSTEVDGERLTPRAIRVQILFMIGAGSETTRNLMGSMLYRFARDPELYARLRADRALVDPVIEESLRMDPPAQFLMRRCLHDADVAGTPITTDDSVMISLSGANWDDAVFPQPERFDPSRPDLRNHLAFGAGPHVCPGAPLARLETRSVLNAFLDRFESIELGEAYEFDFLHQAMLHGPESLRLVFREAS